MVNRMSKVRPEIVVAAGIEPLLIGSGTLVRELPFVSPLSELQANRLRTAIIAWHHFFVMMKMVQSPLVRDLQTFGDYLVARCAEQPGFDPDVHSAAFDQLAALVESKTERAVIMTKAVSWAIANDIMPLDGGAATMLSLRMWESVNGLTSAIDSGINAFAKELSVAEPEVVQHRRAARIWLWIYLAGCIVLPMAWDSRWATAGAMLLAMFAFDSYRIGFRLSDAEVRERLRP